MLGTLKERNQTIRHAQPGRQTDTHSHAQPGRQTNKQADTLPGRQAYGQILADNNGWQLLGRTRPL